MARSFLAAVAVLWGVAGVVGLALAIGGADLVVERLPMLVIDQAAIGRTVAALAIGCLLIAAAHATVAVALARRSSWALSAGVLLSSLFGIGWVAGGAAVLTSGAAGTIEVVPAAIGGALCWGLAAGYGTAAVLMAARLRRSGSAS